MANHVSALKRVRQTLRRTARNRMNKGVLRAGLREIREVIGKYITRHENEQLDTFFRYNAITEQ